MNRIRHRQSEEVSLSPIAEAYTLEVGSHCSLHQSCTITDLFTCSSCRGFGKDMSLAEEKGEGETFFRKRPPQSSVHPPYSSGTLGCIVKCRRDRRRSRRRIRCTDRDETYRYAPPASVSRLIFTRADSKHILQSAGTAIDTAVKIPVRGRQIAMRTTGEIRCSIALRVPVSRQAHRPHREARRQRPQPP